MVWSVVEFSVDPPVGLDDDGGGVVPETIGAALFAAPLAILLSSDPYIHAAVRAQRAAVGASRDCRGHRILFLDDEPLRLAAALVGIVLAGRRLVAQAELQ